MAVNQKRLPISAELRPAYYDDFHCLAAGCRLSCCKNWRVTFDKKDYLALKRQSGTPELNQRMKHCLCRIRDKSGNLLEGDYAEFLLTDRGCPLLREDGLCHLQVEKGPDALPMVCRTFPRAEKYSASGYLERSLSPACEGVLDLLWDLPDGVEFIATPLPREKQKLWVCPDNQPLLPFFQDIRSVCIDLLQSRRVSLAQRILLMGMALKELADGETNVHAWMGHTAMLAEQTFNIPLLPNSEQALAMYLSNNVRLIVSIPNPDPNMNNVRMSLLDGLGVTVRPGKKEAAIPLEPYLEAKARYGEQFRNREYFMENLMVSLFFYLSMPNVTSLEGLWKSYINFCNVYGFCRFMAVMSCRKSIEDCQKELFRLLVYACRMLVHNRVQQAQLRDELFQHGSATLAHMAVLLCG